MEIFIGWLAFAVLAGWIASNKGRSGIGVFLLSIVLSPLIGIIVALVMKSGDKIKVERDRASGAYRKCPACAEEIKSEAIKCRYCGTDVAPAVAQKQGLAERITGMKIW